jgi:hypothetical protein
MASRNRRGRPGLFAVAVFTKKARPAEAKRRRCFEEPHKDDPKNKERKSSKRLVLKANGGVAYVVATSARPPRGAPGQLLPLSFKGSTIGYQSSSSGTAKRFVLKTNGGAAYVAGASARPPRGTPG